MQRVPSPQRVEWLGLYREKKDQGERENVEREGVRFRKDRCSGWMRDIIEEERNQKEEGWT